MSDHVTIDLRSRDGIVRARTLVSPEDAELVEPYKWYRTAYDYAETRLWLRGQGRHRTVKMHRLIMDILDAGPTLQVDHINGERLDNRRENLRVVTAAENQANRHGISSRPNRTSRFRGVWWCRTNKRWMAGVQVNKVKYPLGWFETEDLAAEAVSAFRREHMPTSEMDRTDGRSIDRPAVSKEAPAS
jgi:hypothetical protein